VCYQDCPTLYYANDTTQQCEKCISPCLTCSSSSVCQTCVTSYSLDGTSCNTSCSNNKISINQVCTACDGPCLTCVVSTSNCTSCQSGLLYNQQLSTCTSSCQAGYYKLATNSTCVQVCPQLYYTTATECVTCPPLCIECTSSINCSACSTGNYYYSNMCYSACPAQAPFSSADGHSCVTCSVANCLTCSSTLCITCNIGYLLIDRTSCIISCPVNETYNATSLKC
jgi:proprotein convertase subtilisin/kexin type 5